MYKKISMKDLKEFKFENHYKRIDFIKEDNNYSLKKQKRFSNICY